MPGPGRQAFSQGRTGDGGEAEGAIELSAAVMVYNGLDTLDRCLDALAFCDEVVVVDDLSTDGTWERLQARPGVRAVRRAHTTFAAQRAFARDLTRGRWVLTMDADEYVTEALARAIRAAIRDPGAPDGFLVRRRNPYPRGLRGEYTTWHPRLVRREVCRWVDTESPHSPLDVRGLSFRRLRGGVLEHEPVESVAVHLRKSLNRSVIIATQQKARGRRTGVLTLVLSVLARFLRQWVRGDWRYGRDGFVMASIHAFDGFAKHALLLTDGSGLGGAGLDGGPGSYAKEAGIVEGEAEGG